jgi:hypothetical protein
MNGTVSPLKNNKNNNMKLSSFQCSSVSARVLIRVMASSLLLLVLLITDEYGAQVEQHWQEKTEVLRENCATLSTINLTWTGPGLNLGLHGKRTATNCLSF